MDTKCICTHTHTLMGAFDIQYPPSRHSPAAGLQPDISPSNQAFQFIAIHIHRELKISSYRCVSGRNSRRSHPVPRYNRRYTLYTNTMGRRGENDSNKGNNIREMVYATGGKHRKRLKGPKPGVRLETPLDVLMEMDRGIALVPSLVRALRRKVRLVHRVPTKRPAAARHPPLALKVERAWVPRRDAVARQRALIGDSSNDEQRRDNLSSDQPTAFAASGGAKRKAPTWVSARMGKKISATWLPAPQGATNNNELTA